MLFSRIPLVVIAFVPFAAAIAAPRDQIDLEIGRLRQEIERVQSQRREEAKQVAREKAETEAYRERTGKRFERIAARSDSLRNRVQQARSRNDSLRVILSSAQNSVRELQLRQERLRTVIRKTVSELRDEVKGFPPLIQEQYFGPINHLLGEIDGKSVDNVEALHRLTRIVQDIRTLGQDIQVVEGTSPVAELRGTVFRLRIGGFFEAVVDMKGERGYRWHGNDPGTGLPVWNPLKSREEAASILSAVRMREGKTVPQLVDLPLGNAGEPQ